MEPFTSPYNTQCFLFRLLSTSERDLLAYATTFITPCCLCNRTSPNPTGRASEIIRVSASLSKYANDSALDILSFNSWNDLACSLPQTKGVVFVRVSFRSGSAVVARFGINLLQKFTKPKKLRTSAADWGSLALSTQLQLSLEWDQFPSQKHNDP